VYPSENYGEWSPEGGPDGERAKLFAVRLRILKDHRRYREKEHPENTADVKTGILLWPWIPFTSAVTVPSRLAWVPAGIVRRCTHRP